jgi:hypothetical protein
MVSAQLALKKASLATILLVAAFAVPTKAWAATGGPQNCVVGEGCTIGEFLYDDNYQPIPTASASCKISSHDPSGNVYLPDTTNMPGTGDGWYSYNISSTPATTGVYSTDVCCTVGSEYLCIDKTFEVVEAATSTSASADTIAAAVWGYSGRTLTSFGDLASNVWTNSERTLSSFSSLISDIWDNSSRTITGTTGEGTDTEEIKKIVKENRLLLEELVNKPIIENFLEEDNTPDLNAKINDSKTISTQLYVNYQYLGSRVNATTSKWDTLEPDVILATVSELSNLVGDDGDLRSSNSIFGQVGWMHDAWDWDEIGAIFDQTRAVKNTLASIREQVKSNGKTRYSYYEMKSLVSYMETLETILGNSESTPDQKTVFSKLSQVEMLSKTYDEKLADLNSILLGWGDGKSIELPGKVDDVFAGVSAVNKVPNINSVLALGDNPEYAQEKRLKNKVLGLRAIVSSNIKLLALGAGKPLKNTWVQEGSIVFKSLITNPSKLITQDVPLKYYLPPEVKQEDIIETSDGLSVSYDAEKNQSYVEGEFNLKPEETKTVMVRVEDIWVISDDQLESLRKQAGELSKPLEKTSYFAQGVTLTSDINVSLDKIKAMKSEGVTPEAKIKAYREAQIELLAVAEKMDKLQELVTQAGSTSTLFGFVGGAQTLAVWGLIIVMLTGFVSLVVYMRTLGVHATNKKVKKETQHKEKTKDGISNGNGHLGTHNGFGSRRGIRFILPFIIVSFLSALVTAVITSVVVKNTILSSVAQSDLTDTHLDSQTSKSETNQEVLGESAEQSENATGGQEVVKVVPPEGGRVNVRLDSSPDAKIIWRFDTLYDTVKIGEDGEWTLIVYSPDGASEATTEGWVHSNYVVSKDDQESDSKDDLEVGKLKVLDTPTGWLNVRDYPDGQVIEKVYPGDMYKLLGEQDGWYQIEIAGDSETQNSFDGWVSSKYAQLTTN